MNQEKIGKFIAKRRKEQKLTQEQLAEKLNITYKAVSKWETGKGMPDSSIMMDLCNILDISVNDLLSGEKIEKSKTIDTADENLIKLQKEKEAIYTSSRWGFGISLILILAYNIVNIFEFGVEVAIEKPAFIIMETLTTIWLLFYVNTINKNK